MCAAAVTNEVYSLGVVELRGHSFRSLPMDNKIKEEQYVFGMCRVVEVVILGRLFWSETIVRDDH